MVGLLGLFISRILFIMKAGLSGALTGANPLPAFLLFQAGHILTMLRLQTVYMPGLPDGEG